MGSEEARRLLDNGYSVLLFRDGLGQYAALAVPDGKSVDDTLAAWEGHEPAEGLSVSEWPFDGPNRMCGAGLSVEEALHAVAEKVILRQLPEVDRDGR